MRPTDEQLAALDIFRTGESMVIEAGAGAGKTSTLKLLAASTKRQGYYVAFNNAIVKDVKSKITSRVEARTMHSLAFAAVGKHYSSRMSQGRVASREIARQLGLRPFTARSEGFTKTLEAGYLGGLVMRSIARYCQTTAEEPGPEHVPYILGIDMPDRNGQKTYDNNNALALELAPALTAAWADLRRTEGGLKFNHEHYLKLWQLSHPKLHTDFILFDEAQDANPVMASIVGEQEHAQRVYVGDSQQAIYEFTGAINALKTIDTPHRTFLTQSFRFGEAIADEANVVLCDLDADFLITGLESIDSTVGKIDGEPDAILCRTNAEAVTQILHAQRRGVPAALEGGGREVVAFAEGVRSLMRQGWTSHPDLACFTSWGQVKDFVAQDAQGGELRLLVQLVDEFGIDTIMQALDRLPEDAALTISTAHKAKGREWSRVKIAPDFADLDTTPSELRLRYVAFTRAKLELDKTAMELQPAEPLPLTMDELDDEEAARGR